MDFAFGEDVNPAVSTGEVGGRCGEGIDTIGGVGQV